MRIQRDIYLTKLKDGIDNGMIKVVTGIRGCGKSYLLFKLFREYLVSTNVDEQHIIEVALADRANADLRDPDAMMDYVKNRITDNERYFILLDDVEYMVDFMGVLNNFLRIPNVEIYVTGKNVEAFQGRGFEIQVHPLCFREYRSAFDGSDDDAWNMYFNYGGMPALFKISSVYDKIAYLNQLFQQICENDILGCHTIRNRDELEALLNIIASSIGDPTNPSRLTYEFASTTNRRLDHKTLGLFLQYFKEAFLVGSAKRYDIRGDRYINSAQKYYYEDVGLRNTRPGLRQQEPQRIMENILYNELRVRGYCVYNGVVELREKVGGSLTRNQLDVDFVATRGSERIYIESKFHMPSEDIRAKMVRTFERIRDSFRKLVVVYGNIDPKYDASGIITIGIRQFLLDENNSLGL